MALLALMAAKAIPEKPAAKRSSSCLPRSKVFTPAASGLFFLVATHALGDIHADSAVADEKAG
jgi:hypothetical protein